VIEEGLGRRLAAGVLAFAIVLFMSRLLGVGLCKIFFYSGEVVHEAIILYVG